MYFKLGSHLLSTKTLANCLLIILIAFSLFVTNICIGIINKQFAVTDAVKNFDLEKTYYYCQSGEYSEDAEVQDDEDIKAAEDNKGIDVSHIYTGSLQLKNKSWVSDLRYISYTATDDKTGSKLNSGQLKSGKWYTDAEHTEGAVNVVALEGMYDVGDRIHISLDSDVLETDDTEPVYMNMIVTGVIRKESYIYYPRTDGQDLGLSEIIGPAYKAAGSERTAVYFSIDDPEAKKYADYFEKSGVSVLTLNDNADESSSNVIADLGRKGWLNKFKDMYDRSMEDIVSQILTLVPFIFGTVLLTVVSLVCIMVLNSIDNMKTYSVYYLCGMNWSDMRKILLAYSGILMLSSCILLIIIWTASIFMGIIDSLVVYSMNNIYITLGIVAFIILIMVFVPLIMLSKSSPKDALRDH